MSAGDELYPAFSAVYDLREPAALQQAHRHRALWGRRYTEVHTLDADHIALVFRPARDARGSEAWRQWERVRSVWIRGEV